MRKSERKKQKTEPKKKPNVEPTPEEKEKPFDFGGIPERDLKKNLGCG